MKFDFSDKVVGGFNFEFARSLSAMDVGSAQIGECFETMERIRNNDFESWIGRWSATADRVRSHADQMESTGDVTATAKALLRASNYYRMAAFYAAHTDPRHTALWRNSKDCFHRMASLLERPIEILDIDFEGAKLPAYFVCAAKEGPRPTLIALGGFDSTMEELYGYIGSAAADHGWNCLIFEGPGQWSALKANPWLHFRPDYEKPTAAVVDYLLTRADVDSDKIALIGYSFGGHLAPRAAAGDTRIKACVANSLVVDCGAAARAALRKFRNPWLLDRAFRLLMKFNTAARWGFQHTEWTFGIREPHEWLSIYDAFTLKGLEKRFQNPMLFLFGEDDIRNSSASTPQILFDILDFISTLNCDRAIHVFSREEGASSHCQMGGLAYARSVIFRWLDHALFGAPVERQSSAASREKVIDAFRRSGGKKAAARAQAMIEVVEVI
jgi:pimeloyl-ACP methyl ester carboxylesterase